MCLLSKIIALIVCLASSIAYSTVWYSEPSGTGTNGTFSSPWPVPYAFTNSFIKPNDTVLFKSGTYRADTDGLVWDGIKTNILIITASGSNNAPVTFKSETLWGFTLFGQLLVPYSTSNLVIRDMHLNYDWPAQGASRVVSNEWDGAAGINVYGSNVTILHNLIENFGQPGIGYWQYGYNKVVEGNIVRFTGDHDWYFPGFNGAKRGAGIYTENNTTPARINGNMWIHNYTEGMLLKTYIDKYSVTNNVSIAGTVAAISLENNHDPTTEFNCVSNYCWRGDVGSVALRLGYDWTGSPSHWDSFGNSNMVVLNNYLVGARNGVLVIDQAKSLVFNTNILATLGYWGDGGYSLPTEYYTIRIENYPMTNGATYVLSGNNYYVHTNYLWNNQSNLVFQYWGTNESWVNWQTVVPDVGSSYQTNLPTNIVSYSFRPSQDTNFVHVAVYNWTTNSSTTVDLSSFFTAGDHITIYDAQNIPNSYTNFYYLGGSISLDLSLTNYVPMFGTFPDFTTLWTGFDPRFRAFVIYKDTTKTAQITTLRVGTLRGP